MCVLVCVLVGMRLIGRFGNSWLRTVWSIVQVATPSVSLTIYGAGTLIAACLEAVVVLQGTLWVVKRLG